MKKNDEDQDSYIHKVRDETNRYILDLLRNNERVRLLVASLESERSNPEDRVKVAWEVVKENEELRTEVVSLKGEKLELEDIVSELREELRRHKEELHRQNVERLQLMQQLVEIERESRSFSEQYSEVEQQNSKLANLYVASYQLHGTVDRQEVLATIQEIIINLIGSEELGIFELKPDGLALSLTASYGIDPTCFRTIPLGSGLIGSSVLRGESYLAEEHDCSGSLPEEVGLTACIPLKLGERVIGAIAIFRLLSQKAGFGTLDYELFDLLATHAATALYWTGLHSRMGTQEAMKS
jgi:hypothetical protein